MNRVPTALEVRLDRREMLTWLATGMGVGALAATARAVRRRVGPGVAGAPTGTGAAAPEAAGATEAAPLGHEAMYYRPLTHGQVKCELCPRRCVVDRGARGNCGVRENRGGRYFSLVYGQCGTVNLDPIEKKPFFHYLPGAAAFSLGTAGCNLHCKDCQNWSLSQVNPEEISNPLALAPEQVAAEARSAGAQVIAYTYNEPVIFYEYMLDCAHAGRPAGLRSVMVSSGNILPEPMTHLAPSLDAIKIDLKSISDDYYRIYCNGAVAPVLDTLKLVKRLGKWLEVVYLVVPTLTDSEAGIREACRWVKENLGPDVPLHFSRFFPAFQLRKLPPTPVETLVRCRQIAQEAGIHYVYLGNLGDEEAASTWCPSCHAALIRRRGFEVLEMNLREGKCPKCGREIAGVWA